MLHFLLFFVSRVWILDLLCHKFVIKVNPCGEIQKGFTISTMSLCKLCWSFHAQNQKKWYFFYIDWHTNSSACSSWRLQFKLNNFSGLIPVIACLFQLHERTRVWQDPISELQSVVGIDLKRHGGLCVQLPECQGFCWRYKTSGYVHNGHENHLSAVLNHFLSFFVCSLDAI